jgi:hypothetical protein
MEKDWKKLFEMVEFDRFSNMSEVEKRIFHLIDECSLPHKIEACIYSKEKNTIIATRTVSWMFKNNRYFLKSEYKTICTITPKRVFCDNIVHASDVLCSILGIERVYSITTKTDLRKVVKDGVEAYKEYVERRREELSLPYSLRDLKVFVENIKTMEDAKKFSERYHDNDELRDLYHQAVALDRKIKMSWSDRKIHDLHMKWTEEIHKIKCRNCPTTPIWQNVPQLPENVELLNSEMRIAEEGHKMHHCIFTNYLYYLKSRSSIAFHVKDFTVMFHINSRGEINFSQAYHAWNKPLSNEDMAYAKSLVTIANNIVTLNAENIAPTQNYNTYQHNGVIDDDFAF